MDVSRSNLGVNACVCGGVLRGPSVGVVNKLVHAVRHGFCGSRLGRVLGGRARFRPRLRGESLCGRYVGRLCTSGSRCHGSVTGHSFACLFVRGVVFCRQPLGDGGSAVSGYPCRCGQFAAASRGNGAVRGGRPMGYVTGSRPLFRRFEV